MFSVLTAHKPASIKKPSLCFGYAAVIDIGGGGNSRVQILPSKTDKQFKQVDHYYKTKGTEDETGEVGPEVTEEIFTREKADKCRKDTRDIPTLFLMQQRLKPFLLFLTNLMIENIKKNRQFYGDYKGGRLENIVVTWPASIKQRTITQADNLSDTFQQCGMNLSLENLDETMMERAWLPILREQLGKAGLKAVLPTEVFYAAHGGITLRTEVYFANDSNAAAVSDAVRVGSQYPGNKILSMRIGTGLGAAEATPMDGETTSYLIDPSHIGRMPIEGIKTLQDFCSGKARAAAEKQAEEKALQIRKKQESEIRKSGVIPRESLLLPAYEIVDKEMQAFYDRGFETLARSLLPLVLRDDVCLVIGGGVVKDINRRVGLILQERKRSTALHGNDSFLDDDRYMPFRSKVTLSEMERFNNDYFTARLYQEVLKLLERIKPNMPDAILDPDVRRLQNMPRMADVIQQAVFPGMKALDNNIAGAWWASLSRQSEDGLFRYKRES